MNQIETREDPPTKLFLEMIPTTPNPKSTPIEIKPDKTLNLNPNLNEIKTKWLIHLL